MGKGGRRVVWDYQGHRGTWGLTERPRECLCERGCRRGWLDAGGSGRSKLVRPGGLGSAETHWGACLCKGQLQVRGSKGQTGATGCLRALSGGMPSVSACAHPCSASLTAGPGGPELQQPLLCQVGIRQPPADPVGTAGPSLLRPVAACGPSAWLGWGHPHSSQPGGPGWAVSPQSTWHGHRIPSAAAAQSSPASAPTCWQRQLPRGVNQSSSPASPRPGGA